MALGFHCRVVCQGHPRSLPALVLVLSAHLLQDCLHWLFPFGLKKKINPPLSAQQTSAVSLHLLRFGNEADSMY